MLVPSICMDQGNRPGLVVPSVFGSIRHGSHEGERNRAYHDVAFGGSHHRVKIRNEEI